MSDSLLAGIAQRDITPPAGKPMAAFPAGRDPMEPRIAEGAHDPIMARALAFRDGDAAVVVCIADVLSFQWPDVDLMRDAFAKRTGLPAESLVLCGTHNHNGPEVTYLFGGSPSDPYLADMRALCVDAAAEAAERLEPARLSAGAVDADISYNRRQILSDGRFRQRHDNTARERILPVDPKVSVLRFDAAGGGPRAALLHFAAHPVILSTPNRLFTAEYPGAALRHFAEATGLEDCAFMQGACGDTHPYQGLTNDYGRVDAMGRDLAAAAVAAWGAAGTESDLGVSVQRWCGELPHRYAQDRKVRCEVVAVRLSPRLAMVFLQGEPFIELSLTIQWRSPFARTLVVGYSNGWIGYVPTRQAYEFGGYGVDVYTGDPPEFSRTSVCPGAGEELVDRAVDLLGKLRADGG